MRAARALHALAFASGGAALAYEVSWTKWLSLTFGSSTLAVSAVVAGFMGGMGLGAWAYHRIQARVVNPLRLYAGLEVGIAATALALTALLERMPPVFASLLSMLPESAGGAALAIRIVGVLIVLLLPTALMGATYPALCSVAIGSRDGVDRHLGALYGWNTIGAALGGAIAGIGLIPAFGLDAAVAVGVGVNLVVALGALALDRVARLGADRSEPVADESLPTRLPRAMTSVVLFVSGVATLGYEILWFRVYRSLAGNSTYAFTIVLVTFLLGLGFGALGLRRVVARGNPERSLAWVQLGIALTAAFGIASLASLLATPLGMSISMSAPGVRAMEWPARLALHGVLALALMLPATLLMGLSFPLASRLYLGNLRRVSQRVGGAVLLANLGSIVGSIGAATWLLPTLGSMGGTRALIAVNATLAIGLAHYASGTRRERLRWLVPSLGLIGLVASQIPAVLPNPWNEFSGIEARTIFQEEGELATVRVNQALKDPSLRGMSIDGTTIGVSRGWDYPVYSKQILLAHLPMWLEPRIRSVLQIGLGSASTLETLTRYPRLEHIEAVEISAAVVRGAALFEESRAFEDPRVRVRVEDAIHHLLAAGRRYDLIIADGKQNADFSGNAKMLSRELYELALGRLTDDGLFVQWIGITNLPDDFAIIARTAGSVFPHLNVFFEPPRSVLFVGSRRPLAGRDRMPRVAVVPAVSKSLATIGIRRLDWLRLGWMADRTALLQVFGEGPVNRWSNPVLEFGAYRVGTMEEQGFPGAINLRHLIEARQLAIGRAPAGVLHRDPVRREAIELVQRGYLALLGGDRERAVELVERALSLAPGDAMLQRARQRIGPR